MNKKLFFLAIAALGLAACSNDDVVEINQSLEDANTINFRPFVANVTRAVDADLSSAGAKFYATALKKDQTPSPTNTYFDNIQFTKEGVTFTSGDKYYWPSDYNLDFYAYAPAEGTNLTRTDYKTFSVTANTTVNSQIDFVYADTKDWGKITSPSGREGRNGVTINFRHAESKVIVKLMNSNSNLKFTVGNVVFGNLYGAGTFTHNLTSTDGQNSGNLANTEWAMSGSNDATYTLDASSLTISSSAQQAGSDMILIPQTLVAQTSYSAATSGAGFTGAYISVQLKIQNVSNNAYIIGGESSLVTALWPVQQIQWVPGYKYIYTVDLAGGGYSPTNVDNNDADLDPILDGGEIMFATVTLDAWDEAEEFIGNLTYGKGTTNTYDVANGASGQYSITITGLTPTSTVSATGTGNFTASPTVTPATVGASGSVTITGVLSANADDEVTSVITLTETSNEETLSTTTINIVQAASE